MRVTAAVALPPLRFTGVGTDWEVKGASVLAEAEFHTMTERSYELPLGRPGTATDAPLLVSALSSAAVPTTAPLWLTISSPWLYVPGDACVIVAVIVAAEAPLEGVRPGTITAVVVVASAGDAPCVMLGACTGTLLVEIPSA